MSRLAIQVLARRWDSLKRAEQNERLRALFPGGLDEDLLYELRRELDKLLLASRVRVLELWGTSSVYCNSWVKQAEPAGFRKRIAQLAKEDRGFTRGAS
jgi:hypothetical protein